MLRRSSSSRDWEDRRLRRQAGTSPQGVAVPQGAAALRSCRIGAASCCRRWKGRCKLAIARYAARRVLFHNFWTITARREGEFNTSGRTSRRRGMLMASRSGPGIVVGLSTAPYAVYRAERTMNSTARPAPSLKQHDPSGGFLGQRLRYEVNRAAIDPASGQGTREIAGDSRCCLHVHVYRRPQLPLEFTARCSTVP